MCDLPAPGVRGKSSGEERSEAMAVAEPGDIRQPAAAAPDVSASTASTASSNVGSSCKIFIDSNNESCKKGSNKLNESDNGDPFKMNFMPQSDSAKNMIVLKFNFFTL